MAQGGIKRGHNPVTNPLRRIGLTVSVLGGILVVGVGAVLIHIDRFTDRLIEDSALEYATLVNEALTEFRTLYTSEVVGVAERHGIEITHDYSERDNAIPLPSTLSIMLGDRIEVEDTNARTRLYSPYPFPRRKETGGIRDDFGQAAWEYLSANPDEVFARFTGADDVRVL